MKPPEGEWGGTLEEARLLAIQFLEETNFTDPYEVADLAIAWYRRIEKALTKAWRHGEYSAWEMMQEEEDATS